jgi:predicted transposase/invertase (TIGR01784 family)
VNEDKQTARKTKIDFDKIGIKDDIMFSTVLGNPEDCRELLQRILGIVIVEIKIVQEQKTIKNGLAKGVRLDIYVKDEQKNAYDIEMQLTDTKELELRSRYYHSEMDGYQIRAGEKYRNLKQSVVIFICDFDLFKKGKSVYTFESICTEDRTIKLRDKRRTVFVNINGSRDGLSRELRNLLDYFQTESPKDEYTKKLQEKVAEVRKDNEWRENYMTWEMKLDERWEQGMAQGVKQGMAQGKIDSIINLLDEVGEVSETLVEYLNQQSDMDTLAKWLKLAARADSVEEFEEKIGVLVK